MSHARAIVAIPADRANDVQSAIEWEMMPFDENGEWFRDGSRWDWYVIGGRYTGSLTGYDPEKDPANTKVCSLCGGTGKRTDMEVKDGCNGCQGKGTRVKWPTEWADHPGDIIQVKNLNLAAMLESRKESLIQCYAKAAKDSKQHREFLYGVDPDEITLDAWLADKLDGVAFPAPYAFVQSRHWHEAERMGWFGTSALTECEIKAKESENPDVETMIRRCKYKDPETGAAVVCWNEPYEVWSREFYHRFIERLDPETILVNVDYHV